MPALSSDIPSAQFIAIGRVGAPYGVKGWLKVLSFTDPTDNLLSYEPLFLERDGQWSPITISDAKAHGKGIVLQFAGCTDRDAAALYTHHLLGIRRSQLPTLPTNEYYWSDLIGLAVYNQEGLYLGKVDSLLETGANDVLLVYGERKHAIPYLLGRTILQVDLKLQKILVDWDVNF